MRVNVAVLARAQGLRDDFESLQRLRRGRGITGPDDLCYLSPYVKRHLLQIEEDTENQLKRGLDTLRELVRRRAGARVHLVLVLAAAVRVAAGIPRRPPE